MERRIPFRRPRGEKNMERRIPLRRPRGEENMERRIPLRRPRGEENMERRIPIRCHRGEENMERRIPIRRPRYHSSIYGLCLGRVDYGGGSESAFPYASRPRDGCPRHGARSFILFMCLQQCHHSICHHGSETYGEADSDPPHSHCIEYLRVLLWVDPPSTGYVL